MQKSTSEQALEAFLLSDSSGEALSMEDLLDFGVLDRDGDRSPFASGETWYHDQAPKQPNVSATNVSYSSISYGTAASSLEPTRTVNQALGGTSRSEQSDSESLKMERIPFEQTPDVIDIKRMRRMESNRKAARVAREKKQTELANLELQVNQLHGEHSSLYVQLTDASQQFNAAATNNLILKSNVEALRIKVKMAADLFARGTLTCSSIDLPVQNSVGSPQFLSSQLPSWSSSDFPTVEFQSDDSCYLTMPSTGQFKNIGVQNGDAENAGISSGLNQMLLLQSIVNVENLHDRIPNYGSGSGFGVHDFKTDSVPKRTGKLSHANPGSCGQAHGRPFQIAYLGHHSGPGVARTILVMRSFPLLLMHQPMRSNRTKLSGYMINATYYTALQSPLPVY